MFKPVAVLLGSLLALGQAQTLRAESTDYPERTVCGSLREATAFWLWSRLAGRPNPARIAELDNAGEVSHRTRDGRLLRGYKLDSTAAGGEVRGSLLVAGGNAMLADQLLPHLQAYAAAGIEPYVFDYRGYGRSEGKPRLQAIVGDRAVRPRRSRRRRRASPLRYLLRWRGAAQYRRQEVSIAL